VSREGAVASLTALAQGRDADPADELADLAGWISDRLDDEHADRQHIAEVALAVAETLAARITTDREARRQAAPGPFPTWESAYRSPAVLAVYAAGPVIADGLAPSNETMLSRALSAAGVSTGAYDRAVLEWLAGWEPETCAVIAGWVARAACGLTSAPDSGQGDAMSPVGAR
jgi:hypothetical protein